MDGHGKRTGQKRQEKGNGRTRAGGEGGGGRGRGGARSNIKRQEKRS
jgi:hypothetical protein